MRSKRNGWLNMEILEQLINIDYSSFIFTCFVIMSGFISGYTIIGKVSEIIGKPVKWVREKQKDHKLLIDTIESLKELYTVHEESVKQSIRHDEMIKDTVKELSEKVELLSKDMKDMKDTRDSDKLAEYKNKIGESYRLYNERKYSEDNPIPYWNHIEKESLEGLIKQYEFHGGKNSFVHSIVEPEIQKWKVVG